MLEQRRQQYLSVLGIENYVPRRIAAGAASSILLSDELLQIPSITESAEGSADIYTDAKVGVEKNIQKEINAATDTSSVPDVSSLLQGLGGENKKIDGAFEATNKTERLIAASTASEKVDEIQDDISSESSERVPVNFALSVWRVSADCLVIDSREPGTALPTDRLLQNILRTIGYSVVQLPPSETIRWPVFIGDKFAKKKNGSSMTKEQHDNEVNQARAMVQAYITAQTTKMPIKTLVVMGKNAMYYSLDEASDFAKLQGTFIEDSPWQANVIVTPSLFSMLQEPLLKEVTWAALQSIPQ